MDGKASWKNWPCTPDRRFHCRPPPPAQKYLQDPGGGKGQTVHKQKRGSGRSDSEQQVGDLGQIKWTKMCRCIHDTSVSVPGTEGQQTRTMQCHPARAIEEVRLHVCGSHCESLKITQMLLQATIPTISCLNKIPKCQKNPPKKHTLTFQV